MRVGALDTVGVTVGTKVGEAVGAVVGALVPVALAGDIVGALGIPALMKLRNLSTSIDPRPVAGSQLLAARYPCGQQLPM